MVNLDEENHKNGSRKETNWMLLIKKTKKNKQVNINKEYYRSINF